MNTVSISAFPPERARPRAQQAACREGLKIILARGHERILLCPGRARSTDNPHDGGSVEVLS